MDQSSSSKRSPTKHNDYNDLASSFDKFFKTTHIESQIISQETITLIKSQLKEGNIQGAVSAINDALIDIENAPMSIAVTGETGTGKSSFINALRGLRHQGKGAAPVGVTETTTERESYQHPKFPNVTIWDLPGIGCTNFPPKEYLKKMKFLEYDFFIIISATRFRDHDAQLATAIEKMRKKFYFVRAKIDSDLQNDRKCNPSTFNKERTLEKIRDDCHEKLLQAKIRVPQVFLISSFDVSDYDFPNLETTLLRELPAHKRYIFMLSLPCVTEATIDRRRESLKQKVWLEALKAGISATMPLVGCISDSDVEMLEDTLNLYRSYFGLDNVSLENMAEDLDISIEQIKAIIKSPHLLSVKKENESLGEKLLKCMEKTFSVIGTPIASGLYFRKTFYLHSHFLDTVANDAKALLNKEEIFISKVHSM
ncbi:interferon-gamma-inducible GTPase 10 [Dasypus novemcinctus]|uniref:Interferon-gamma-inducible GTPase IFGGB1 protein n=1 Tax=Dasypus novemcinctus TaxID=9361 RepID=J7P218_DASNO|nr:interferon-gamma-inducible GTPase 10-like [Dasypus novemcinctus]XP_058139774.1 interferon-gamma-inducible GTPase 10-like [Dasypus novemcinctus]CBY66031.1 TPA: interferon-gamma-inducible GTPase IFGGB1 protein [Dasypus novemcinctus]